MGAEDFSDREVTFDDIVDNLISVEDQLKFLDRMKEKTSFSKDDVTLILCVIVSGEVDKTVKFKALEVLLNDSVRDLPQCVCEYMESLIGKYRLSPDDWLLPLKVIIKVELQNASQFYLHRIFGPFLVQGVDQNLLKDYERYLVKNLKYFNKSSLPGFPFYQMVEQLFFQTEDLELKSEYIDAMFYLDMWRTLLRIISDISLDLKYRKQAILVSLKLLPHSDSFNKFSENFFYALKDISNNPEEEKSLKNLTDHIITSLAQGKMSLKDNDNARNIQGLLESGVFDD